MGEFVFLHQSVNNIEMNNPLSMAKKFFIEKDFEKMISILEPVINSTKYNKEYKMACVSNLAMAYHVRGYYDSAKEFYGRCNKTIISEINYYAFCHRYFEYKNVLYKSYTGKLQQIFEHNQLNYILNVFGADAAIDYWKDHSMNLYDEQIFNNIKGHRDNNKNIREAIKYEKKYLDQSEWIKYVVTRKNKERKKIGIFLTDLQRHKKSAVLYQVVEELYFDFDIIIYFNNIFQNKLIKSFQDKACIKDVSHMSYGEIINLINYDSISLLIDMAEYDLRNNSIAVSNSSIKKVALSDIMMNYPLIINSDNYFPKAINTKEKDTKIIVLGDLRFVEEQDLNNIKNKYQKNKIVFLSQALDEPLFMKNFFIRLRKCGFNMEQTFVKKGIRPFLAYMQYISSCDKVLLLPSITITELSEVIRSGVNYEYVSVCKMMGVKMKTDVSFSEIIRKIIEDTNSNQEEERRMEVIKDLNLCFYENNIYFNINCTCNGDLLVFDDIQEKKI